MNHCLPIAMPVVQPTLGDYSSRIDNQFVSAQPIICLKTLAVDHVRYAKWKALCARKAAQGRTIASLPDRPPWAL